MKDVRTAALVAAATMMSVTGAAAQGGPPPAAGGALFVSPMGEPYRSETTAPIRAWFARADANGDERLTRAEFEAQAMSFFFNVLDANHDRVATSLESTNLWRAEAPEMLAARTAPVTVQGSSPPHNDGGRRGARDRPDRRQSAVDAPAARPFMLADNTEPVMSCDTNMSRSVDATEFERCAARRFLALDENGDGVFTLDESERARNLAEPPHPRRR
jgi:hypothetical protein